MASRIDGLERLIAVNPGARVNYIQLADLYIAHGQSEPAIAVLERFLEVDPQNQFVRNRIQVLRAGPAMQKAIREETQARRIAAQQAQVAQDRTARLVRRGALAVPLLLGALFAYRWLFPAARPLVTQGQPTQPQWAPAGDRLAYLDGDQLWVVDVQSGDRKMLAREVHSVIAWSRDGLQLAFAWSGEEGHGVYAMDATGGTPKLVANGSEPSWSPDGTSVAMLCEPEFEPTTWKMLKPGGVCVVNRVDGSILRTGQNGFRPRFHPRQESIVFQMSPTGEAVAEELASAAGDSTDDLSEFAENVLAGGDETMGQAQRGVQREAESRMHDQGSQGLTFSARGDIWVVEADGRGLEQLTTDGRSSDPRWSPDGSRILYVYSATNSAPEVWTMDPHGGDARPLMTLTARPDAGELVLSPDGRYAVYTAIPPEVNAAIAETMARAAPLDVFVAPLAGGTPRRVKGKHSFKQAFTLSPDGKRLVYQTFNAKADRTELWLTRP